jgi:hypothetical protein
MKEEEDVAVVIKMKPELYLTIICKHAHKIGSSDTKATGATRICPTVLP